MWLAPILPGVINNVYAIFNKPWSVSHIKLWNYGKTPSRGVKEIAVSIQCSSLSGKQLLACFLLSIGNQSCLFFLLKICTGYCKHVIYCPQVLVDSLLVFSGTVPRVSTHARGILPTLQLPLDPFIIHLGQEAGLVQTTAEMSLK